MGYWQSLRSKWLYIGQVLFFFCIFIDLGKCKVLKLPKKEQGQYPAILTKQAFGK